MEFLRNKSPAVLAGLAIAACVVWLVVALRGMLTPVLLAFMIAYLVDPIADWFERRMSRTWAVVLIFAAVLLPGVVVLVLLVPIAIKELGALGATVGQALEKLAVFAQTQGLELPTTATEWVAALRSGATDGVVVSDLVQAMFSGTLGAFGLITGLTMTPVFSFYFLRDFDRMVAWISTHLPQTHATSIRRFFADVDQVLGAFVRGQLIVMLALGMIYAVGLWLVGLKLGFAIGLLAGLASLIPYLGTVFGVGLAFTVAFVDGSSMAVMIGVATVFAVGGTLEGLVITPKVMGDKLGLPAVAILLAVLAFGELLGFFGVLLAVPLAAVSKIVVERLLTAYRTSELYGSR